MPDAPAPHLDPGDIAPLEQRLGADQIAELDAMNAGFGGPQLGESDDKPPVSGDNPPPAKAAEKTELQPKEKTRPEPPAEINTGDLPPEDVVGDLPTKPAAGEEKTSDFKKGEELMPDSEIEKLRTDKSRESIKGLRTEYNKAIDEIHVHKRTIKELQAKPDTDARVADLERRNAELNAIVERKALDEHPEVIKMFTKPRQDAIQYGRKALEDADMDPNLMDRVIGTTGKERIAALDQLYDSIQSQTIRSKVEKAVAVIEGVDDQRAAFFADREGNHAKMKEQEKVQQERTLAEQEKNVGSLVDNIAADLASKGFCCLAMSEQPGADRWNEGLKTDLAEAKKFLLTNTDPNLLVAAALMLRRAPKIQAGYRAMLQRALAAEKTLAEGKSSLPKLNGSGRDGVREVAPNPGEGLITAGRRVMREVTSGE
jgi:hypothetical protein